MADEENIDPDNPEGEAKPEEPKGPFKPMGIDVVKKALSKLAKTYGNYPFLIFFRRIILCVYCFKNSSRAGI